MRENGIGDAGLAGFGTLTELRSLSAEKNSLTGPGLEVLARLPKLETLNL